MLVTSAWYAPQDEKCRFKKSDIGSTCSGYTDVASKDEKALQQAVADIGPVSVAIDASHQSFQVRTHTHTHAHAHMHAHTHTHTHTYTHTHTHTHTHTLISRQ